jgi:hypothetical protein
MPPTIRSGQLATTDVLSNQLVIDMQEELFQYDPPGSPGMTILTKRAQVVPAQSTKVEWLEDEPVPYWFQSQASSTASGATSLVITASADAILPGALLKVVSTNEVLRVTAVNSSTNTLTVTRGYIGTAATIPASSWIINLSVAEMEGDVSPTALATVKVAKYNYTSIVKTPVHLSNTNLAVKHYTGDERALQRRKAAEAHSRRWEEIMLHGRAKLDTSTASKAIRFSGGLDETIATNVLAAGGTLTESSFNDFVGDCFRYSVKAGRSSKLLFASREVIATINSWGLNKLQLNTPASTTYGMSVSTYVSGFGDLQVISHPLLENGYAGTAYIIDPDGITYRPLRRTQLHTDIQNPSEDGVKDEIRTEASFQFALEKSHGKITGVTF